MPYYGNQNKSLHSPSLRWKRSIKPNKLPVAFVISGRSLLSLLMASNIKIANSEVKIQINGF